MALEQTFVTPSVYSNAPILDVGSLKGEENCKYNSSCNNGNNNRNHNHKTHMQQFHVPSHTRSSVSSTYKNNVGPSPFPPLETFIRNHLAGRKGFQGEIRAWTVDESSSLHDDFNTSATASAIHTIIYQMKNNRWCENIQRCHKSNNIMWNVSLDDDMTYWQSCHDPECRLVRFRGSVQVLPKDVQDAVRDILLERSIKVDAEFEAALASLDMPVPVPVPVPVGNDSKSMEGDLETIPHQEIDVDRIRVGDDPCDVDDDDEFGQILAKALKEDPSLCP